MSRVHGLHHVTAIAGDPRENLAFYTGVLGLRLVKRTVNQDAIDTYHFFYADAEGSPGTDLTFFPWPQMAQVRRGTGLADEVSLAVPVGTLDYWSQRLLDGGVAFADTETRFGETCLPFQDPHGLRLSLVETTGERPFVAWGRSPVSEEHQISRIALGTPVGGRSGSHGELSDRPYGPITPRHRRRLASPRGR